MQRLGLTQQSEARGLASKSPIEESNPTDWITSPIPQITDRRASIMTLRPAEVEAVSPAHGTFPDRVTDGGATTADPASGATFPEASQRCRAGAPPCGWIRA